MKNYSGSDWTFTANSKSRSDLWEIGNLRSVDPVVNVCTSVKHEILTGYIKYHLTYLHEGKRKIKPGEQKSENLLLGPTIVLYLQ